MIYTTTDYYYSLVPGEVCKPTNHCLTSVWGARCEVRGDTTQVTLVVSMTPARKQSLLSCLYLALVILLVPTILDWLSFSGLTNRSEATQTIADVLRSNKSVPRSAACRFRVPGNNKRVQFTCGRGSFVSVVKSVCKAGLLSTVVPHDHRAWFIKTN